MLERMEWLGTARCPSRTELDGFLERNFRLRLVEMRDAEPPKEEASFAKARLREDVLLEDAPERLSRRDLRPAGPTEFLGLFTKIYMAGGREDAHSPLQEAMHAAFNSLNGVHVIGGSVIAERRISGLPGTFWITVGGNLLEHMPITVPAVPVLKKGDRILLVRK